MDTTIERDPRQQALDHMRRGAAALEAGDAAAAVAAFRTAADIAPTLPEAHHGLGLALKRTGRRDAAIAAYRAAVALRPDDAETLNNLGVALSERGDFAQAAAVLERAAASARSRPQVMLNLGKAWRGAGAYEKAAACLEQVVAKEPANFAARLELGSALRDLDRLEEALAAYRAARRLAPGDPRAANNLAMALQESGRVAEAVDVFREAASLAPEHAEIRKNLGMALLLAGRYGEGFREYEWRWRDGTPRSKPRPFDRPRWDGGPLDGETLLLWGEQGVGDEILFASMIPDALARAARTVIECDPRLVPLFRRSFPQASVVARTDLPNEAAAAADVQSPTGSLGGLFRAEPGDFPSRPAYLIADRDRTVAIRARFAALGDGLKIGIAWRSGNPSYGRKRTIDLDAWALLLKRPRAVFVNLQYGDCDAEIAALRSTRGVDVHVDTAIDPLRDLDGFAAQVAALDLVISIDNATVHMAGALGKRTWTLLPFAPDWRWGLEREESVWYPSMRLFRQPQPGDWAAVLANAAGALDRLIDTEVPG